MTQDSTFDIIRVSRASDGEIPMQCYYIVPSGGHLLAHERLGFVGSNVFVSFEAHQRVRVEEETRIATNVSLDTVLDRELADTISTQLRIGKNVKILPVQAEYIMQDIKGRGDEGPAL